MFCSTGTRRPFDEKPSHLGSWVSTLLRPLTWGKYFLLFLPDSHSAYYDSFVSVLGRSLPPPSLGLSRICCTWSSFWRKWWVGRGRGGWWDHPPAVSARNWTKYNKSLKDPVRGAGSAQVQIRSYRNRQSGNLARKVRNTFPGLTALRPHSVSY